MTLLMRRVQRTLSQFLFQPVILVWTDADPARSARGSVDQSRPSTVEEVTYWRKAMLIDEDPHGQEWKNPTTKGRKGAFIRDFCTLFLVGSLMEEQDRVMEYLSRHIDGVKTRDRPARPGLAAARSLLFLEHALYFNYSQY
jgi:hypothetical protein